MVKKDYGICQIKYWYNNDMKLSEKSWLHDFSELITILDHYYDLLCVYMTIVIYYSLLMLDIVMKTLLGYMLISLITLT